jgi:hypothetical protein
MVPIDPHIIMYRKPAPFFHVSILSSDIDMGVSELIYALWWWYICPSIRHTEKSGGLTTHPRYLHGSIRSLSVWFEACYSR